MTSDKRLTEVEATHVASGACFQGYEIHIGRSEGPDTGRPFAMLDGQPEGAQNSAGTVAGSYLHGMFQNDAFRSGFLANLGATSDLDYSSTLDSTLDALSDHVETHLNVSALLKVAR
jgi:adenosylcobyric acid synthase